MSGCELMDRVLLPRVVISLCRKNIPAASERQGGPVQNLYSGSCVGRLDRRKPERFSVVLVWSMFSQVDRERL